MERIHVSPSQIVGLNIRPSLLLLAKLAAEFGGLTLYHFGSSARGAMDPSDIDILVLYEDADVVRQFRRYAEELDLVRPLHLVAMTPDEEVHYAFIRGTRAICITQDASTGDGPADPDSA